MIITYHGLEFFKIQFGDIVIALNPFSKSSKFKNTRFGADIALISINDKDMNGAENLSFGGRVPFVVSGPGEYEVKGIFVKGYPSKSLYGGSENINVVYSISLEGMEMCFLGALSGGKNITTEIQEVLEGIDILFVPIGGDGVLTPSEAYKLAVKLEPKIIIPMHYSEVGSKDALKNFLKEGGEEGTKAEEKLTLKRKDLEEKEGEIVVLSAF